MFIFLFSWSKKWNKLVSHKFIIGMLRFLLLYRIFAYGIVPDLLRLLTNGSVNNSEDYKVKAFEILRIVVIQNVSDLIYFLSITFFLLIFRKRLKYRVRKEIYYKVALFLVIGGILLLFLKDILLPYLWIIIPFFSKMFPALSICLLHEGIKIKNPYYKYIGALGVMLLITFTIMSGLRGMVVSIFIVMFYFFWFHPVIARRKVLMFAFIAGGGFLAMQGPLKLIKKLATIERIAKKDYTVNYTFIERVEMFLEISSKIEMEEKNIVQKVEDIFEEIQFRFGASTMFGVGFLRMRDRGDSANFVPIYNSLYSFLPRQIVGDDKPYPSSIDGTEEGMAMYLVVKEINQKYSYMTDFAVGGHYYWELGWLGVFVFSFIPALYIVLIIRIAENASLIGFALFFSAIKSFQILPKMWISEMITLIPTIIIPSIFFGTFFIFTFQLVFSKK